MTYCCWCEDWISSHASLMTLFWPLLSHSQDKQENTMSSGKHNLLCVAFISCVDASAIASSSTSSHMLVQEWMSWEMWSLMEGLCAVLSCVMIKHKTAHYHIPIKLKPTWVTARWFQFFPSRPMHEYRQKRKRGPCKQNRGMEEKKNKNGRTQKREDI